MANEPDKNPEPAVPQPEESVRRPRAKASERYYWVRFHNKSNHMDPDEVVLSVNGMTLMMRRDVKIPLPASFLEVADHARYKHYTQQPGQERKVDREILKYPYEILGEATREDFVHWKTEGTDETRKQANLQAVGKEG